MKTANRMLGKLFAKREREAQFFHKSDPVYSWSVLGRNPSAYLKDPKGVHKSEVPWDNYSYIVDMFNEKLH